MIEPASTSGEDDLALFSAADIPTTTSADTSTAISADTPIVTSSDGPTTRANINGTNNDDDLDGGGADDFIQGFGGDDTIDGRNGDDTIDGGSGSDSIRGQGGSDSIIGDGGSDTIDGGGGSGNTVTGGAGADTFRFDNSDDLTITDFDASGGDFVDLSDQYSSAADFQADLADDGILNDSNFVGGGSLTGLSSLSGVSASALTAATGIGAVCFLRGTRILTNEGEIRVEDLQEGMRVLTLDHGYQPIRWIGSRKIAAEELANDENLYPVRIEKGALGENMPQHDLWVTREHKVLVRSKIAERMFGEHEVQVPAKDLLGLPGVSMDFEAKPPEYFHILLDEHEMIFSNGTLAGSLYMGAEASKALSPEALREIFTIFPELAEINASVPACRPVVRGKVARQLVYRHQKNDKEIIHLRHG